MYIDYTCRARWPEGLLCSTISLKSCNLAQILQSPKSEIVTCVMFSTHTNTSLIKPHLTELDEIHRNRPKSNYNLAKNLQSWSFLERYMSRFPGRWITDTYKICSKFLTRSGKHFLNGVLEFPIFLHKLQTINFTILLDRSRSDFPSSRSIHLLFQSFLILGTITFS